MQDEEQEAQEARVGRDVVGKQLAGGVGRGAGSPMTVIRKPAAVKASVIACSDRCQKPWRLRCRPAGQAVDLDTPIRSGWVVAVWSAPAAPVHSDRHDLWVRMVGTGFVASSGQ